ncbi:ORF6N domain-containing protein [bacterium]|nr:ORF6N domain-containing protein [bacterium]MBR6245473.1 ORF6N domain-containing protein [bacterium]
MENEIVIHNENDLRSKIYTIRGMRVMLDFDLAETYGYSVKAFNQQVKNNIEKFDEDFRFQLTWEECNTILKSKILTSSWGGIRKLPYAFTEQGIYMLMTVLRGDLAIKQSKILIRLFKTMKDFIIERENLIGSDEVARLAIQTSQNTKDIARIDQKLVNMTTKDDVLKIIEDFSNHEIKKDFLFLNGKSVEADLAYQQIYAEAKETIFVIDNYIGLKTLVLLKSAKKDVKITIFSDNIHHGLHKKELDDFIKEYPQISVSFKKTSGIFHDRYIILDFGTENEKIYHCGASSKDAGNKVCSISTTADNAIYRPLIENLLTNSELVL